MSLRDNLANDAAKALRVRDAAEMSADGSVAEAIELMKSHETGCVFMTEHGKPIGVFTERDLLTRILAGGLPLRTTISDVMTANPSSIDETCSVAEVIRRMHQGGFRHMPVVDGAGSLRGVVSVKRVVEYLVEHFPAAVLNLPPEPVQRQVAREGA